MHMRSPVPDPIFRDKVVQTRILVDMYVAGELVRAGETALMQRSDADALRSVGRVELVI